MSTSPALTEYRRYNNTLATCGHRRLRTRRAARGRRGGISSGGQGGGLWRITLHAYGDADDLKD